MNLMPEILQKLGVEVGERFDIKGDGRIGFVNIHFDETYCLWDKEQKNINEIILLIIVGEYEIIKKPWEPQNRERGYYVNPAGDIIQNAFFKNNGRDVALVVMGNCFETEEEAEAAKPEMIAKMKEAWGESQC